MVLVLLLSAALAGPAEGAPAGGEAEPRAQAPRRDEPRLEEDPPPLDEEGPPLPPHLALQPPAPVAPRPDARALATAPTPTRREMPEELDALELPVLSRVVPPIVPDLLSVDLMDMASDLAAELGESLARTRLVGPKRGTASTGGWNCAEPAPGGGIQWSAQACPWGDITERLPPGQALVPLR